MHFDNHMSLYTKAKHQQMRSILPYALLISGLLLCIASCGDTNDRPNTTKDHSFLPPSHQKAHQKDFSIPDPPFFIEDHNCQSLQHSQSLLQKLNNISYWNWMGQNLKQQDHSTHTVYGLPALSSFIINGVYLPQNLEIDCHIKHNQQSCSYPQQWSPAALKICRSNAQYSRTAVETIGLSAMVHLEKSYRHYKKVSPSAYTIPQANIYILPKMTYTYIIDNLQHPPSITRDTIYNNLSYRANFYNSPAFFIHPPSNKEIQSILSTHSQTSSLFLWESDWNLAHEFGHHILISHIFHQHSSTSEPNSASYLLTQWMKMPMQLLQTHHQILRLIASSHRPSHSISISNRMYPSLASKNKTYHSNDWLHIEQYLRRSQHHFHLARTHIKQQSWQAFNETFADLWAFYSTDNSSSKLQTFPCLAQNRDVTQPYFQDHTPKIITDAAITALFNPDPKNQYTDCTYPDFHKYHFFAAAIAHAFYAITIDRPYPIESRLILLADSLSKLQKSGVFLEFTNHIARLIPFALAHLLAPKQNDITSLSNPLTIAIELDTSTCNNIAHYFPAITAYHVWQQQSFIQCNFS